VRMQAENHAILQLRGASLDASDRGIAVFHRERKRATHQRRAHAPVFARRHTARMYEPLGAAADGTEQRPHAHLIG